MEAESGSKEAQSQKAKVKQKAEVTTRKEQTKSAPPASPHGLAITISCQTPTLRWQWQERASREHLASSRTLLLAAFLGPVMYVHARQDGRCHVRGRCSQTPPPSPSCQSLSVAACAPGDSGGVSTRALCGSREYQSGQDPENPPHTYPKLRHSCHTAVDMLSPGDMPSSMGGSVDCGLEAERFTVGG